MNQLSKEIIKAAIMGFVVPVLLLSLAIGLSGGALGQGSMDVTTTAPSITVPSTDTAPTVTLPPPTLPSVTAPPPTETLPPVTIPQPEAPVDISRVKVLMNGKIVEMNFEYYVLGVMLAEVPYTFQVETLKAQAIAIRSYTIQCVTRKGNHEEGVICTSSGCCQAYESPEDYIRSGDTWVNLEKIWGAVKDTEGLVLKYADQVILAMYFSCAGGKTESAVEVFGMNYPYLQSVESPGEEVFGAYSRTKSFTAEEFQTALGVTLSGDPQTWFGDTTYTTGGGVNTMKIGDTVYTGLKLREKLRLRSTVFEITVENGMITFDMLGFGHRVGMSQYGAEAMARAGSTYEQILLHYYTECVVAPYLT